MSILPFILLFVLSYTYCQVELTLKINYCLIEFVDHSQYPCTPFEIKNHSECIVVCMYEYSVSLAVEMT